MQQAQGQSQAQESQPPGLFQPVLGQVNQQQFIHFRGQLKALLFRRTVILELYEDRVVVRSGACSYFFLLDEEIFFEKKVGCNQIKFQNRETEEVEVFATENLIELETFCQKLKPLCPQRHFRDKYTILETIGQSARSKVFKARSLLDGNLYAAKKCQYNKTIQKQLEMLRQLKHPNLIYFHEYFIGKDQEVYLILEYCDGGNLLDLISSNDFSEKLKHRLMKDLLNGLEYLRIKGIVHRDLKPENILYSKSFGAFTIADFGVGAWQNELQDKIVGTPGYIAPEMFKISKENPLPANITSDIYAAGLILYQVFTSKQFFKGDSQESLTKANLKGNSFKHSNDGQIHKQEACILRKMIRREPKNRRNSYQIMKSECMSKLNKVHGIDLKSISTESPNKRNSNSSEQEDEKLLMVMKNLLKIRSSSN